MDEASKLVFELQSKLTKLDHKVWLYRRDMASEFTKYAEGLLRDVPRDVSETVSKALARSIKEYKSLNLDAAGAVESCAAGTSSLEIGAEGERPSQPTKLSLSTREEVVDESPGGPHDREKALQGLFTPSYLPLLDATHHRSERKSSSDSQISLQLENKEKEMAMDNRQNAAGTEIRSLTTSPKLQRPPAPKRRNTDEVSITSDWSSDGTRRSALRRVSTSSNKQLTSPRRVRFEVEGEEVLPTASPLPSQLILSTDKRERSQSPSDDSDEEGGSEQIEDVDEPSPKRISSSQALRALSRNPVADDGTQWTTVTAPPDGSASVAVPGLTSQDSSSENLPRANGSSGLRMGDGYGLEEYSSRGEESSQQTSESASQSRAKRENYDSETSSDGDMLDMPPLRSMKGQKSTQSPTYTTKLENIQSPTASSKTSDFPRADKENFGKSTKNGGGAMRFTEEDDEQLFHFDENTDHLVHRSPPKEQDEPETSSPTFPVDEKSIAEPANLSQYSQSPARPIVKPGRTPTRSNDVSGTFNGHPFSTPIVNPEIHAQAASLGDVNSFVGSIHGRSGVDEGDMYSFRQSGGIGSYSGTPKSMTERLYMDELKEADETREKERSK
ncbi:hypothetical protein LHYA1_G005890 [Lachnellula hyalina]|uniref:Uncharacterized protein n=1 Tax=Lachnellula hyalina TaxID=1316788 RepID=A0A8H8TZK8_9HELO|nr:uncharacterized protein LHYA1_G005890 [Lachnellula hyalina]TVY25942.1 hypothetical protein LHYA1_G005890 [Lachnellula hyalina]